MQNDDKQRPFPIRTFSSDLVEALRKKQGSVMKIALAEAERREMGPGGLKPKKNKIFLLGSVILVLAGLATLLLLILGVLKAKPASINQLILETLIPAETYKEISVTNREKKEILAAIAAELRNNSLRLDTIENLLLVEETPLGKESISAGRFLSLIESQIPAVLLRSLADKFMLGIYAFDGNNSFILLKTNSYDNAFAGMLRWEENILFDLSPIFGLSPPAGGPFKFKDKIIKNKDARVIENEINETILFYLFLDKEIILIASEEDILTETQSRLFLQPSR